MAKFDDFLSDPSFDDLDALNNREQLFALGGAAGKAKRKAKRADRKQRRVDKRQSKVNKLRGEAEALLAKSKPKAKVETKTIPDQPSSPGLQGDGPKKSSTTVNKSKVTKKPTVVKKVEAEKTKQSFGQAFSAARKAQGAGGTFMHNGKKYTTNRADDAKPKATSKATSKATTTSSSKPKKFVPKSLGQVKTETSVKDTTRNNKNTANSKGKLKVQIKPDTTGKRFDGQSSMGDVDTDINVSKKAQGRSDFYANSTSIREGETTVKKIVKKKNLRRGGRTY